ncbi:MAG: hypothetical protein H6713_20550 [Myxococcales bacterium]|nr:hypothetical protein [Myxococcales bacterium]MCB9752352.1 hypothetical protein [Myxococcales bacterium]
MPSEHDGLRYEWVLAGLVAAAGRFVPLPFAHGVLRRRAERWAVRRTARARGLDRHDLNPLWGGDLSTELTRALLQLPLRLLLFPIRRVAVILSSAYGVPRDAVRPILLGRAVVVAIDDGHLAWGQPRAQRRARARALRVAFDHVYREMDFLVLRAALADMMANIPRLRVAVHERTLALLGRSRPSTGAGADAGEVATEVAAKLGGRELSALFAEFDRELRRALTWAELAAPAELSPAED